MESDDFFADHVYVGRPIFLERFLRARVLRSIADGGDVVGQRVEPNVNHMLRIVGNRNAPGESRAADGEIAQARLRTNEVRILIKLKQLFLKRGEFEEIIFFMHRLRDAAASGARIAGLRAIDVEFIRDAVLARVSSLVNEALVAEDAKQLLHTLGMALFRGADVVVVGNAHALPQRAKLRRDLVGILLWSFSRSLRGAFNLLAVLVGTGEK